MTAPAQTEAQRQYREEYLRSDHWRDVRLGALERAEHRCQVCNTAQRLDVHHRTYERLGKERPADLTVLCRPCHDLFHGSEIKRVRERPAKKQPRQPQESAITRRRRKAQTEREDRLLRTIDIGGPGDTHMLAARAGLKVQITGNTCAELRKQGLLRRSKQGNWHLTERS